jgi:sugar (pentulose or hexulose) kinase
MATGARNAKDATGFWTNYVSRPHEYLYESFGVRRGMWTVSWFRDLLGEEAALAAARDGMSVEEALNRGAAWVPPGSDGLMTVLDWLAPPTLPTGKGSILGFDGRQDRFHINRSILEALALTVHGHATTMAAELGADYRQTIVSGGGSQSDLMLQNFADVFGVPALRASIGNAAGVGAAICAAVGVGLYATFEDAVDAMVRPGTVFHPHADTHRLYRQMYEVRRDIFMQTDPINRASSRLFG